MDRFKRFWSKVKKTDGCWEWQGATNKKTGQAQYHYEGENTQAYRVAWIFTYGNIPDGLYVCHHYDNPACVRPDHLFLGTALANSQDRDNKGRGIQPTGERNGVSKLTIEDDAIKQGKTWREV